MNNEVMNQKFLVMILVRNEEKSIRVCLQSVKEQSVQPDRILVYDDGSTNGTTEILNNYNGNPFQVVKGSKAEPHSYARAFLKAKSFIDKKYDYIGILDADTKIEPTFYEKLLNSYTPLIFSVKGIISGNLEAEPKDPFLPGLGPYPPGANRLYSWKCWTQVNNNLEYPFYGIDAYHYLKALALGYQPSICEKAQSWSLRPKKQKLANRFKVGFRCYFWGYSLSHMLGRSVKNKNLDLLLGYWKARSLGIAPYLKEPKISCPEEAGEALKVFYLEKEINI